MAIRRGDLVRRRRDGRFDVRLDEGARTVITSLVAQLRQLLTAERPSTQDEWALRRLFPAAYPDDEEFEAQYQEMVGDELLQSRLSSLDLVEATIDEQVLEEEELLRWMAALNDIRLVLGTKLDVDEDLDFSDLRPEDPDAPALAAYGFLGLLLEHIIDALGPPQNTGQDPPLA